jgi:hypothetical protein
MKRTNSYKWLRWVARVSGTLMVIFTLFMFFGEMLEGSKRHEGQQFASITPILFVIFAIWGVSLVGLVVAWWKEGLGGIIALAGFWLLFILNLFNKEASMSWSAMPVFVIFSIPAILYLIYWKLNKDELKKADAAQPA